MGMSTSITGVRDLDGTFKRMMEVKLVCDNADIGYPQEVEDYFDEYGPGESEEYLKREMECIDIPKEAIIELNYDSTDGIEIDISKLSSDIKKIRFLNSW